MDVLDGGVKVLDELRTLWRHWLDPGVFLLAGLAGLFFWRLLCGYGCGCFKLSHLNHIFLLYVLVLGLALYGLTNFVDTVSTDYQHRDKPPERPELDLGQFWWLRGFLWLSPVALVIVAFLSTEQALMHMYEITRAQSYQALWRHDRAILVVAMPLVFGVMMLNSTVPVYQLALGENYYGALKGSYEERKSAAVHLKNGYFFVADVYEAWAFYQFSMLVLELIQNVLKRERRFRDDAQKIFTAMADLMWLGPWLFIMVCLLQAAFSVMKQLTGHLSDSEFSDTIGRFEVAGFVASGAAIYNVGIIERRFGGELKNFSPFMKFFSVQVLVSLAFFQKFMISSCQTMLTWNPALLQELVGKLPFLGDILRFSDVQMHLFYPTLMTYECLLVTLLHSWAWDANEEWYEDPEEPENIEEATPLIPDVPPVEDVADQKL